MSTQSNDGGPAFPQIKFETQDGDWIHSTGGMTLRDYFAAKVMASMILDCGIVAVENPETIKGLARESFVIADAMLAERKESK